MSKRSARRAHDRPSGGWRQHSLSLPLPLYRHLCDDAADRSRSLNRHIAHILRVGEVLVVHQHTTVVAAAWEWSNWVGPRKRVCFRLSADRSRIAHQQARAVNLTLTAYLTALLSHGHPVALAVAAAEWAYLTGAWSPSWLEGERPQA